MNGQVQMELVISKSSLDEAQREDQMLEKV